MAIATAPVHDPHLDTLVASEVASELLTVVAGKKLATTVGRRVPVVGGLVGLGIDGVNTWRIGRYVDSGVPAAQPPVDGVHRTREPRCGGRGRRAAP